MDEKHQRDLRHWVDEAGAWHLELEPDRLRGTSDVLLNRLQARLTALTTTVIEITTDRPPYNSSDRSFDELVDDVAPALPGPDRTTIMTMAAAVFVAIVDETDDLHAWSCYQMYQVETPERVDQAAHRLFDLLQRADDATHAARDEI